MDIFLIRIKDKSIVLLFIMFLFLFSACNTVKYVPEDKYLLDRNYLRIEGKNVNKKDVELLIQQKPNKRILGLVRFHLGLYNLSKPGKNTWFSKAFRKIGEEPVIYDDDMKEQTKRQINLYLKNKGYYNSLITDTLLIKRKTVRVHYSVKTGVPYKLEKLNYLIEDSLISKLVLPDSTNCLLKTGSTFDIDQMQNERLRIEAFLKNRGYFNFNKEYIYFKADSAFGNHTVHLLLGIKKFQLKSDSGITYIPHLLYKLGNVKVIFEKKQLIDTVYNNIYIYHLPDTVMINDIHVIYQESHSVKPNLLVNKIYLAPGQLYSQRNVEETYKSLSSLKIFKFVNIVFEEDTTGDTDSIKVINCRINLATTDFQSFQTEAELTNSEGFGVSGSLVYQHKNLFKGAEIFDFKVNGATEAIKQKTSALDFRNTIELGSEVKVQFPKYLLPFRTEEFIRRYNPKTSISIAYSYKRRPDYTHAIANISFGYNWNGNRYTTFQLNPVDINYVKLLHYTPSFKDKISNTYLEYSFSDHLVPVTSFSYTFNNQRFKRNSKFIYFRFNEETAGNSARLLCKAFDEPLDTSNSYQLFSITFSQYIKSDVDFRYYRPLNTTDKIVYRVFIGVGYPYGNSKTIPFEKQYFAGGANSLRAWQIRNLGPGTYKEINKSLYPDKTADMKLEANIEYRFKLFWILEGALFIDAGNIWSIKDDTRTDAVFHFNSFYNQLAIGPGIGTRFDFSFFIFRFDLGFQLRDPINKWAFGKEITRKYLNPTIGIGYPF